MIPRHRHRRTTRRRISAYAMAAALVIAAALAVPAHALDGSDGRFGIGKGRYDHFKPDPKRVAAASCTPVHDRLGDEWVRAEGTRWQGKSFDLIGGGTRVVGPDAMVSVGGTTYAIWPCLHGVGTS